MTDYCDTHQKCFVLSWGGDALLQGFWYGKANRLFCGKGTESQFFLLV